MKIVCAWCGKEIGKQDGKGVEGVSHGVCKECFDKVQMEAGERIRAEGEQMNNKPK